MMNVPAHKGYKNVPDDDNANEEILVWYCDETVVGFDENDVSLSVYYVAI